MTHEKPRSGAVFHGRLPAVGVVAAVIP